MRNLGPGEARYQFEAPLECSASTNAVERSHDGLHRQECRQQCVIVDSVRRHACSRPWSQRDALICRASPRRDGCRELRVTCVPHEMLTTIIIWPRHGRARITSTAAARAGARLAQHLLQVCSRDFISNASLRRCQGDASVHRAVLDLSKICAARQVQALQNLTRGCACNGERNRQRRPRARRLRLAGLVQKQQACSLVPQRLALASLYSSLVRAPPVNVYTSTQMVGCPEATQTAAGHATAMLPSTTDVEVKELLELGSAQAPAEPRAAAQAHCKPAAIRPRPTVSHILH